MSMTYAAHDQSLAGSFQLICRTGAVEFQFPPRVVSDGRASNWNENNARGIEPIAVFMGTGPRTISLNIRYIVDGCSWTGSKIAEQVRKMRGHNVVDGTADNDQLVAEIKMWGIGGGSTMSARIVNVDVKHGEAIVGDGDGAYPLVTDVSLDVRIWSQGGKDPNQIIQKLKSEIPQDWY